ncbi:MAG: tetratricopeptide repeat protein [Chlorobiaceae bacterium]|nr:tetratricopeptide repeat protein [Chlorobiaceae bacterium]
MHRLLPLLIALFSFSAVQSNLDQYHLFSTASMYGKNGDHTEAIRLYRTLLDRYPAGLLRSEASFNLADAEYRLKHYRRAADLFESLPSGNSELSRQAGYNRGNALAMAAFENSKSNDYKELLGRSLACYRRALLDNPRNTDARINYEIVLRAMRSLSPPPPSPAPAPTGGGSGNSAGRSNSGVSTEVANMILNNARQEESRQMQKYFKPVQPRKSGEEQPDW